MNRPQAQFGLKFLPSLADFAFLLPIVFVFARMDGTQAMLSDGDTGWHIRTGEWILAHGCVPLTDIFSFSRPGQPWYAWEWLWDVAFALLFRQGGLALVVLASIVLLCLIFVLLFRLVCRYATPLVALPVTMTATVASSIHWLARPHLFTLLFTVIFLWLLELASEGRKRLLWVLPLLTVLWTNLHGGFFVGIILAGGYAAGELLRAAFGEDNGHRREFLRDGRDYLVCAGACLLASLLNPYTYKLHQHVVEYLTDSYQKDHIIEFFSLNFHHPIAPFFEFMLLAGAVASVWHLARGNYRVAVLLAVWGHGALLSMRNIPIFAIVAAPFLAGPVQMGLERLPELPVAGWLRRLARGILATAGNIAEMEKVWRFHPVSLFAVAAVAALLFAPAPPKRFRPEYDPKAYPEAALRTMHFGPNARIFANDEWGDYLIFRLYPTGTKVFVDGRSDFYGRAFEEKYLDAYFVKYDWEQILHKYGIDTILLPVGAALAGALKESSHWHVVYDDGITLVFRPSAVASQVSIAQSDGKGRDREITKTVARDPSITIPSVKSKI